jgi:hypothetical protein
MNSLWALYNSEESFLPFFLPLIIWVSTLIYTLLPSKEPRLKWGDWTFIHQLHNLIIIIGWISLYFDDDSIFHERIGILWSLSYFLVDFIYCAFILREDQKAFILHALLCLALGLANYHTSILRTLRMNSRAAQCELSTPFLYLSRKTRKPHHFILFAIVFTMCRIIHIPYFLILPARYQGQLNWNHWIMLALLMFYALNCFWYVKILRILISGGKSADKSVKKKD